MKPRKNQMVSKRTKDLFWLNVKSGFCKFGGGFLLMSSLIVFFFSWVLAVGLIVLSIFLLIKGHQQRLEYKMRSGYIVYN